MFSYQAALRREALTGLLAVAAVATIVHPANAKDPSPSARVWVLAPRRKTADQNPTRAQLSLNGEKAHSESGGSLADSLRGVPAVSVQQTTPGQGSIYIRGLSGRFIAHEIDGVRLNSTLFRAGNNPYLGLIDPLGLSQIHLTRGAASVLHGNNALAGAISLHTPTPGYSLGEARRLKISLFQSTGIRPSSTRSHVGIASSGERNSFYVGGTLVKAGDVPTSGGVLVPRRGAYVGLTRSDASQGYQPLRSTTQEGTKYSFYAFQAAYRQKLGKRTQLINRAQLALRPDLQRFDQLTPRFKRSYPRRFDAGVRNLHRIMLSSQLQVRGKRHRKDRFSALVAFQRLGESPYKQSLTERCLGEQIGDTCNGSLQLGPSDKRTLEQNRSDALSLKLGQKLRRGKQSFRFGIDGGYEWITSRREQRSLPTSAYEQVNGRFPDGATAMRVGLYGQWRGLPFPHSLPALSSYAGVRGSLVRVGGLPGQTAGESFSNTTPALSAGAGIGYKLSKQARINVNVNRGYRAPNVADYATTGSRAGGRFQVPNQHLEAESSLSLDAGMAVETKRFVGAFRGFYQQVDGALGLAPTRVGGQAINEDGELFVRSENSERLELVGWEAEALLRTHRLLQLYAQGFALLGTVSQSSDPTRAGETFADRMPPLQGEVGVISQPTGDLELRLFARGRAKQDRLHDPINTSDNRIPAGGTPGFVTLHLRADLQATRALRVGLLVDNILGTRALEHGSGFYLPSQSAMLNLSYRYDSQ